MDRLEAVEGEDRLPLSPRSRGRLRVAFALGAGLVALALGAGWLERRPLVQHFADRALADRHVPARYRLAAIGPFAERLEDVRIGDPAHPDLVARAVELHLGYGLDGVHLAGITADGVRLRAAVVDGKVSFGVIDRLLPAPSTSAAPLALPDMAVRLTDARVSVATPAGAIGLALEGQGNLADGFHGRMLARTSTLVAESCAITAAVAALDVRIADRKPLVKGPVDLAALNCNGLNTGAGRATVDLAFARSLDRWQGGIGLAGFAGAVPGVRFGALSGRIGIAGGLSELDGDVTLASAGMKADAGSAAAASVAGRYRYLPGSVGLVFAGTAQLDRAALAADRRRTLTQSVASLAGSPVGPLAVKAAAATDLLLRDARAQARIAVAVRGPAGTSAVIRRLDLTGAAGGGHVRLDGGRGIGWTAKGLRVDGRLTSAGGGLPVLDATLAQARPGAPVTGIARLDPYQATGARLALTPVRFAVGADGRTRFDTVATLDGPLGEGRIEGLTLPLAGHIGAGGMALGEGCMPIALRSLSASGVVLAPTRITACGVGDAPIISSRGIGVQLTDAHIAGRSGAAPLSASIGKARFAGGAFAADAVSVRLGVESAQTRLDVAHLDGAIGQTITGHFADTSGQIGPVPLLFSGASGTWGVAKGALGIDGAMTVADAAPASRFQPLLGRDVHLTLFGGRIAATGTLAEPKSGIAVANVTLHHDLGSGSGGALLDVPGLTFIDKGLQPEALTPLTLGVIANVNGTIAGKGAIDWTARGVASSGDFATEGVDLAAAFGPVKTIVGKIHFSDLLGLVTPPHQEALIAEVNPGIAVTGGVVHYQLVGNAQVQVEDARWPFAGGTLALEPSLLDFDEHAQRHLTFRVNGLDAAAFVQQLDLPNLSATGMFDGVLPMIFDQSGGRIEGGMLTARRSGGTIAYIGDLTNAELGTMGKLAFDALKAIRYNSLSIGLDGRLDGEIVSLVKFEGVRQATGDAGMVARLIYNLPFRFNIAIRAPFRGLLGSARSYIDPSLLLQQEELLRAAHPSAQPPVAPPPAIQPTESEPVR